VQNEHLLTECQQKNNYKRCLKCNEAVNINIQQENDHHFKLKQCTPFEKKGNRCPLCHTNIGAGEEVWKDHLMIQNGGCPKNNRRHSNNNNNNNVYSNSVPDNRKISNNNQRK
jgi:centrosomal protein CEP104